MAPKLKGQPPIQTPINQNRIGTLFVGSNSITAEIEILSSSAKGVIVAQGANFGGWALFVNDGHLKYVYNFLGLHVYEVEAPNVLSQGKHEVKMESNMMAEALEKVALSRYWLMGKR